MSDCNILNKINDFKLKRGILANYPSNSKVVDLFFVEIESNPYIIAIDQSGSSFKYDIKRDVWCAMSGRMP